MYRIKWRSKIEIEVKPITIRQPRYSKKEFAQRGKAIYEAQVRSQVEEGNHGKIVAIDIETGDFEVANSPMLAVDQLYVRSNNSLSINCFVFSETLF